MLSDVQFLLADVSEESRAARDTVIALACAWKFATGPGSPEFTEMMRAISRYGRVVAEKAIEEKSQREAVNGTV